MKCRKCDKDTVQDSSYCLEHDYEYIAGADPMTHRKQAEVRDLQDILDGEEMVVSTHADGSLHTSTADEYIEWLLRIQPFTNPKELQQLAAIVKKRGAETLRLRERVRELEGWQSDVVEREGACCPEDVPFDEMIRMLQKKLSASRQAVELWEILTSEWAKETGVRINRDKGEPYLWNLHTDNAWNRFETLPELVEHLKQFGAKG